MISEHLSPEITELLDNKEITKATALLVCKLTPEEQIKIFNDLELHNYDNSINEQLNKAVEELTVKDQNNQKLIEQQAEEIDELKNREPEQIKVEVKPEDYEQTKQLNESYQKKIADLENMLSAASKTATTNPIDNTPDEDNSVSSLVSFIPDKLPSITEISPMDEIEGFLKDNPDERILSDIYDGNTYKRICFQILEQSLGLTDENNKLQVSYCDYRTHIRKYDGSNYEKLAEKIQKNILKSFK